MIVNDAATIAVAVEAEREVGAIAAFTAAMSCSISLSSGLAL
ncbi:MAG: hypothetical protein R3C27_14520 [Hyphomonadaceae bacterium]